MDVSASAGLQVEARDFKSPDAAVLYRRDHLECPHESRILPKLLFGHGGRGQREGTADRLVDRGLERRRLALQRRLNGEIDAGLRLPDVDP